MEQIVIYLFMVQKFTNLKQKILRLPQLLCLANISKDQSVDNMKKTGFNGYVYDFSVDYDVTAVDDIKDIHKKILHFMKKNNIAQYSQMFRFIKKIFLTGLTVLSSLLSVTPLTCTSMNN